MNKTDKLLTTAAHARQQAYAPYSDFSVGAAVLGNNGKIYAGANVENIRGRERSRSREAILKEVRQLIADGCREISEILIIAETKDPITPCGACLQRIKEFSGSQTIVHLANLTGIVKSLNFNEFLPLAFNNMEVKK